MDIPKSLHRSGGPQHLCFIVGVFVRLYYLRYWNAYTNPLNGIFLAASITALGLAAFFVFKARISYFTLLRTIKIFHRILRTTMMDTCTNIITMFTFHICFMSFIINCNSIYIINTNLIHPFYFRFTFI